MKVYAATPCMMFTFDSKTNFDQQHQQMETFFLLIGIWDVVKIGFEEPTVGVQQTTKERREFEKLRDYDITVRYCVVTKVELQIYNKFMYTNIAKEAWIILMNVYRENEDVKRVRLQQLRSEHELTLMKPTKSIKNYFSRIQDLLSNMRSNGDTLTDTQVVGKILRSLNNKFHINKIVLEATKDLEDLGIFSTTQIRGL